MKKSMRFVLSVALALIILCTPAFAVTDSSVMVRNESVALSNAEVNSMVQDMLNALPEYMECYNLEEIDFKDIFVKGAFPVYQLQDGKVTGNINKYNFHVYYGGKLKGVISIISTNGSTWGEYSIGYAEHIVTDEGVILFEDENAIYCMYRNNTNLHVILEKQSDSVSNNLVTEMPTIDNTVGVECKTYRVSDNNVYNTGARTSVSVPMVTCYGTLTTSTCYDACIASTVRVREPDLYGNLTAEDVREAANAINKNYAESPNNAATGIKKMMHDLYLDNGSMSHYSLAFDESISISSYKQMIDNGNIITALLYNTAGAFTHAVIMCGYTTRSSGGVLVNNMEPATGTFRLITWSSGDYQYDFSTSTSLIQKKLVVSYY